MLAGGGRGYSELLVHAGGGGDVDDIDVVPLQQVSPVGGSGFEAEVVDGEVDPLRNVVGDGNEPRGDPFLREVCGDAAIGAAVRLAHPTKTDDTDTDGLAHVLSYLHTSGLTRCGGRSPLRAVTTCSKAVVKMRRLAPAVPAATCGGDDDVEPVQQRMVRGQRLGVGDVEPCAEEVTGLERCFQGDRINEATAGGVDEDRPRLHLPEEILAHQPGVLAGEGHMQRHAHRTM